MLQFYLSLFFLYSFSSIDASAALALPGVVAFLSAKDIVAAGGQNSCGMFPGDEELFASTEVGYVGQPIGLIVANSPALAEQAAKCMLSPEHFACMVLIK
jgi:xanthine dehydrogenase molybdopterin-binding subunit B